MLSQQLKTQVEAGVYRPDPALIAEAMLQRPSVRDLLAPAAMAMAPDLTRAGQTPRPPEAPRRAA